MPASLVQAGFILFYSVRCSIALQLHLLSWWSSIIMEFGAGTEDLVNNIANYLCLFVNKYCTDRSSHWIRKIILTWFILTWNRTFLAGRWIEGVRPWRGVSESLVLMLLAVVFPAALSAYWESQFRRQLLQQDEIQQQLDIDSLEQKVGPWSFLLNRGLGRRAGVDIMFSSSTGS